MSGKGHQQGFYMKDILFFRKRSGRVVKFNQGKIASAIARALKETQAAIQMEVPTDTPELLAQKVCEELNNPESQFYVQEDTIGSRIPKLEDVQDAVETVIGQVHSDIKGYTEQVATTINRLYSGYRKAREEIRNKVKVISKRKKEKVDSTDKGMLLQEADNNVMTGWDRNRLENDLNNLLKDEDKSADIAKRVEKAVLKSGLQEVTSDLIAEFANNELTRDGLQVRLNQGNGYLVEKDFIDALVASKTKENSNVVNNNPEAINMAVAEYVLKKWGFDSVFSSDVVEAHQYGFIYIHDLGSIMKVYCSSHSVEYLKKYGLQKMLNLNTVSKPAKSASVLTGHINTFLASMQSNYAGALGLGYINVFYAPLLRGKSDEELHQVAQELIFNGSQNAFSRGGQTLFLDFNIHTGVPESFKDVPAILAGGKYTFRYNDGKEDFLKELETSDGLRQLWLARDNSELLVMKETKDGKLEYPENNLGKVLTYGDFEEEAQRFCKALLTVWGEGDANGHIFEFPKCDFHVSEATFTDPKQNELFNYACEITAKNGSVYFVFDRDSITTAACCFTGDTKVLVRGGVHPTTKLISFEDLVNSRYNDIKHNISVYHNGGWSRANIVELPGDDKRLFKITTVNKKEQKVTEDHIVPTLDGDKYAKDVTEEDYILFSTSPLHSLKPNASSRPEPLTYEQGVLIGAYLGDGSMEWKAPTQTPCVHFSLNEEKYSTLIPLMTKALRQWGIDKEFTLGTLIDKLYPVRISSKELHDQIRKWVSGNYSYEKSLNICCVQNSLSFRRGILDGMYLTDGGNSNRIYSSSKELIDDMEVLCTSLGIPTIIDVSDRTGEGRVVIDGREFNRNFPVYCIRWYDYGNRRQYDGLYRTKNNSVYYKVASIEELPSVDKVYCFEIIDNNEPYFTLPNGIITHNCRLRIQLDAKLFKRPESLRSCGFANCTINIPQCSYRTGIETGTGIPNVNSDTWNVFISHIDRAMDLAVKAHLQKKAHISRLMSAPGLPLWQVGMPSADGNPYIDLNKCVYIIGLIGLDDACRYLFGKSMHEDEKLTDWGLAVIAHMNLRCKHYSEEYGLTFTLEESPAESAARKLARTDLVHFPEQASKIVHGYEGSEYYTNSIHIPADADVTLVDRVIRQSMFHGMIDSGAITHAFIGEETPSAGAIADLVEKIFKLTQSAQITFSPEFTYCQDCHGQVRGLVDKCPYCGSTNVEGETRVVGYFSRISGWNKSKIAELQARHHGRYKVEEA